MVRDSVDEDHRLSTRPTRNFMGHAPRNSSLLTLNGPSHSESASTEPVTLAKRTPILPDGQYGEQSTHQSDGDEQRNFTLSRIIDAAQTDPFNCWPVVWSRNINENFHFLANSFGPSMFGYLANDKDFDIFKSQTQLALTDPAAFHSLMIVSTMRQGQLAGHTLPGMSTMWHRIEAIRLIKERLESGDMEWCITEGSIYSVMCLMGIGAQWNVVDTNEFDSSALNMLIAHKGGIRVISQAHPVLETSLFGMAVLNPGMLRSDLYTVNDLSVIQHKQDARSLLYSLLGFVRATSGLSKKQPTTLRQVQEVFSPGTAAYRLLTYAPDHPGIFTDRQQRLQTRLRAHIVLYVFSILIWASPFQIPDFLHHLGYVLDNTKIWRNSLRMFAWALVCNVQKGCLMFSLQAWQSYEMLCSGYYLPEEPRQEILEYLLYLLVGKSQPTERADELMARIRNAIFDPALDVG